MIIDQLVDENVIDFKAIAVCVPKPGRREIVFSGEFHGRRFMFKIDLDPTQAAHLAFGLGMSLN